MEIIYYKPIEGFEGYYVTSNGMVLSTKYGCWMVLKQSTGRKGYKYIILRKDNKKKKLLIHRLVAQAFIPNPDNLPCVNHKDENPNNNNVDNLEWCTVKYNNNYGTAIQRRVEKQSKKISQYTLDGELVKEWYSTQEAGRKTGWSQGNISACCRGERKTAYGFIWEYSH